MDAMSNVMKNQTAIVHQIMPAVPLENVSVMGNLATGRMGRNFRPSPVVEQVQGGRVGTFSSSVQYARRILNHLLHKSCLVTRAVGIGASCLFNIQRWAHFPLILCSLSSVERDLPIEQTGPVG